MELCLAPQPQEECVTAFFTVYRVIFIIEVQDVFLSLKAKFLVQQHSRVAGGNVKGDVLPHARLHRDETSVTGVMDCNHALVTPSELSSYLSQFNEF